ncbi:MAG: hypothetical protein LQ341_005597, partial [Variospora aurantia]
SRGIWGRIRRALAVDPNRSSGVPLNPQYRNPPPGANPPETYDDPVTVPAGDIAENAYFRRDIRRSYPRLSVVKQGDVVGLLSVGSKAKPKEVALQIGDAGAKHLVQARQEREEIGLAALFEKEKSSMASVLGATGMPPFPTGGRRKGIRKNTLAELLYEPKMPTFPDVAVVAGNPLLHVPVILSNLGIPPRSRDATVTRQ